MHHRANLAILMCEVQNLIHSFAVSMRILTTGFGAVFIHHAIVIGHQERAGRLLKNVVFILVDVQVLGNEINCLHAHAFGQPFDVFFGNNGAD